VVRPDERVPAWVLEWMRRRAEQFPAAAKRAEAAAAKGVIGSGKSDG
jgi:hypothetical protein